MRTSLNSLIASDEATEIRSSAKYYQPPRPAIAGTTQVLLLRPARAADDSNLKVLAALDEQPELRGEVLLAFLDGELVAAMSLGGRRVIAHPFVATTDAVSLLELRAHQLSGSVTWPKLARLRWFARAVTLAGYQPRHDRHVSCLQALE